MRAGSREWGAGREVGVASCVVPSGHSRAVRSFESRSALAVGEATRLLALKRPAGAGRGRPIRLRSGFGRTKGGTSLPCFWTRTSLPGRLAFVVEVFPEAFEAAEAGALVELLEASVVVIIGDKLDFSDLVLGLAFAGSKDG